jgi:cell division protein FtsZ
VVVGTVIDADMTNQIRVTVVATGLGRPISKVAAPPMLATIVPPWSPRPSAQSGLQRQTGPARPTRRPLQMAPTDYNDLDKPAVHRRAAGDGLSAEGESEDMLDIPAFLRRQAD